MDSQNLNFPYYFYPNIPFSGYMNTSEYNENLKKLNNLLTDLINIIDKPILLHITIGASAEEIIALDTTDKNLWFQQWTQLYPAHFDNEIEIIHIIIAPNKTFSSDNYIKPTFIKILNDLKWEKHDNMYESKIKQIKTYIFCTMMPTIDVNNKKTIEINKTKFENIYKNIDGEIPKEYLIESYVQTTNDVNFVTMFYENLNKLVMHVKIHGGITTCFSFAVFCHMTNKFKHGQNYNMFKQITNIEFDLLGEWLFEKNNYELIDFKSKKKFKYNDNSIKIFCDQNKLFSSFYF